MTSVNDLNVLSRICDFEAPDAADDKPVIVVPSIVSIREWLDSEYYIGATRHELFPFWRETIIDFFERRDKLAEMVITGALGTGKSTIANVMWMRLLYEMSCMDSPQKFYGMMTTDIIYLAYLSVSFAVAERTGFGKFRNMIDNTPYFKEHFPRNPNLQTTLKFPKGIQVILGSDVGNATIGHNLISLILDEANFLKSGGGHTGDLQKAVDIYTESSDRIITRFLDVNQKQFPGLILAVSSTSNQSSFTSGLIASASPMRKVVTGALWDIKPRDKFPAKVFYVFAGSETQNPQILETPLDWQSLLHVECFNGETPDQWYKRVPESVRHSVVAVPDDPKLRHSFEKSPLTALANLAGVAITPQGKFFTGRAQYANMISSDCSHPFGMTEIELRLSDSRQLYEYLTPGKLFNPDGKLRRHPGALRFVHIDQATTDNALGVACCHVGEFVKTTEGEKPVVEYDFILRVPAPPAPDRIALNKVPNFIRWLREKGMCFGMITMDMHMSEPVLQEFMLDKFPVGRRSLDAKDDPWMSWSDGVYEKRVHYYRYQPFEDELFELDHDRVAHKVRCPKKARDGSEGRSDVAESVVGAYANSLEESLKMSSGASQSAAMQKVMAKLLPKQDDTFTGLLPQNIIGVVEPGRKLNQYSKLAQLMARQAEANRRTVL